MIAYCFASGLIELGHKKPAGAIALVKGPAKSLRHVVGALARHGYKPGVMLVPGVPEAPDSNAALNAAIEFSRRLKAAVQRHAVS